MMKKLQFFKIFALLLFCFFISETSYATTRYVKPAPAGNGSGSSWDNASDDLQLMINQSAAGDTIWVAGGTYYPIRRYDFPEVITPNDRDNSFLMKDGVKIYGGFVGNEISLTERNLSLTANASILSGDLGTLDDASDNAYSVVRSYDCTNTTLLDGFTITKGNGTDGAGIYISSSDIVLNRLKVQENSAIGGKGGGISIFSSGNPAITNTIISGNSAKNGGGICAFSSSFTITNSVINGNFVQNIGGAIYFYYTNSAVITNVTISDNNDASGFANGFFSQESDDTFIKNSIIYDNIMNYTGNSNAFNISYSMVVSIIGDYTNSNGNISSTDPLFVNPGSGNYRLQSGSPLINKGKVAYFNPGMVPDLSGITQDLDGNPRFSGTSVDIGAYEFPEIGDVCPFPTSLTASDLTFENAKLSWESDGNTFDVNWGTGSFATEQGTTIMDFPNGGILSGLTPATEYQYYVRLNCGGGNTSSWAGPYSFTTLACPSPTDLNVSNYTFNSVDLFWESSGNNFDINWGEGSFEAGEGTTITDFTNGGTLTGLTPDTNYQYYVRLNCGEGSFSDWAGPYSFTPGYCSAGGSATGIKISEFTFAGINNSSTSTTGYENFSSISADAQKGESYTFTVYKSGPQASNLIIWIDFNQNGAFEEDEKVYESLFVSPFTPFSGSINIPNAVPIGETRLRIRLFPSSNPYTDPCGYSDGEVEDYTVDIFEFCPPPTNLTASNITFENTKLSWESDGSSFDINWGEGGFEAGEGVLVTDFANGGTLSGLTPSTDYQYYVRLNCGNGHFSDWAGPYNFTTLACPAPTGLTAFNIIPGSADLSWTSNGNTFDISWGEGSFDAENGTILNDFENGGTLSGLDLGTTYQYYVRRNCGEGGLSNWAGPHIFTDIPTPACDEIFYDSGGLNANYGDNENHTITIFPDNSGDMVSVTFSYFGTEDGFDGLMIYDGNSPSTPLISSGSTYGRPTCPNGAWTGWAGISSFSPNGMTFTSTHSSGALTFVFTSDDSNNSDGWEASVTCSPLPTCHIPTDIASEAIDNYTINFNWSIVDNAEGYDWLVVQNNADPETENPVAYGTVTGTFVTVTGLDPGTDYDFYIQTNCGAEDGVSEISGKIDFTTMALCPAPVGLSHAQLSITSVELNWESPGNSFELKWGEAGFDVEAQGTLVDGLTETSYILDGLNLDTDYQFYVRLDCNATEEGFSDWAGPYSFSINYCTLTSADSDYEYITNVTFAGINNSSGGTAGINDYTDQVAQVIPGGTIPISVSIQTDYSDYLTVFIDWNRNGILDDEGEVYVLAENVGAGDIETFTEDINIPLNAVEGTTRMRVVQRWDEEPTPCSSYEYGEIEDYTVNVTGPVTWTGTEWINGSPAPDVSVLVNGALDIGTDAPGLEVNDLTVSSIGSITIPSDNTLTINGKIINNAEAANFVVENGGNLIQNGAAANTGAITVKRNSNPMVRLDYTMWSSPVLNQNLFGFSPETVNGVTNYDGSPGRIYVYNGASGYVNPSPFDENTVMSNGAGYLFRSPNNWSTTEEAAYEGIFTGIPFNGNKTVSTHANNYTSIGNPYPSNIDTDSFITANPGVSSLYFWNNNHSAGNNYAACTNGAGCVAATGGGEIPNGTIAVGQGFIVGTSGASVTFNNDMRVDDNGSFFKVDELESHRIWLNLNGDDEKKYNQVLVGYVGNATNGVDNRIDGEMFNYQGSAIYNLINDERFVIQGRALPFEVSDVVPLGFRAVEEGKFIISLANFDGLFAEGNTIIYLKDKQLGIIHNLMESDYEFESFAGEFNNRFEIVYGDDSTMGTNDLASNEIRIYKDNGYIVIDSEKEKILSVELFDLSGKNLYRDEKVNANVYQIKSASFGTQVLVVRVQTHDGVIETKKVINN